MGLVIRHLIDLGLSLVHLKLIGLVWVGLDLIHEVGTIVAEMIRVTAIVKSSYGWVCGCIMWCSRVGLG